MSLAVSHSVQHQSVQPARLAADVAPAGRHQRLLDLQQTAGNRAVCQLLTRGHSHLPSAGPSQGRPAGGGGAVTVQRLMSPKGFQEATSLEKETKKGVSKRNRVVAVDQALSTFYSHQGDDLASHQNRLTALDALIATCKGYRGSRSKGVKKLLSEARAEKPLWEALIRADSDGDPVARVDAYCKIIDDGQAIKLTDPNLSVTVAVEASLDKFMQKHDEVTPDALKRIFDREINKLRAIADDPKAPAITRSVIRENLAHIENTHLQVGLPGGRMAKPNETPHDEKYVVNHKMTQPGGTTERLGSLMHELTHVTAGETFHSLPLLLLVKQPQRRADFPGATQEAVSLLQHRTKVVTELNRLTESDESLNETQRALVKAKLSYAGGNKLGAYMTTFKSQLPPLVYEWLNGMMMKPEILMNSGTLVEYDSVMNQILMYLHQWQVPQESPLYSKVIEAAQEAQDRRTGELAGGGGAPETEAPLFAIDQAVRNVWDEMAARERDGLEASQRKTIGDGLVDAIVPNIVQLVGDGTLTPDQAPDDAASTATHVLGDRSFFSSLVVATQEGADNLEIEKLLLPKVKNLLSTGAQPLVGAST